MIIIRKNGHTKKVPYKRHHVKTLSNHFCALPSGLLNTSRNKVPWECFFIHDVSFSGQNQWNGKARDQFVKINLKTI